jgi:ParB/RepB/Spo0J family partition protein
MIKYPKEALRVPANSILDSDRTRQDYGDLESLAESIDTNGLIHPIVIDSTNRLIAGGRRLRAMRDILKLDSIPVVIFEVLDDAQLAILEVEENIRRKNPTWIERILGVAKVHEASKRAAILDPKGTRRWTIVESGEMLGISFSNVQNNLVLARLIRARDKEILEAGGVREALQILMMRKEREVQKALAASMIEKGNSLQITASKHAKEQIAESTDDGFFSKVPQASVGVVAPQIDEDEMPGVAGPNVPEVEIKLSSLLHQGDGVELMYSSASEGLRVDHIICDPPYAIDMLNLEDIDDIESVKEEHDVEDNLAIYERMFPAAYNILKDSGFFIFWYDLDHHEKLQHLARKAKFKVQRWPLIWAKSSPCKNKAPNYNWTKNFEVAMVCRKGTAALLLPQTSSVWTGTGEDLKVQLGHPFVKPIKLWQWIYAATVQRSQVVLDPFAGVGSSTLATIDYGCTPLAFEINSAHYDRLVINTAAAYKKLYPNPKFV